MLKKLEYALTSILVIVSIVFMYMIISLGALPTKYLYPIVGAIIFIIALSVFLTMKSKGKDIMGIISMIISVIVSSALIFACVEIKTGTGYLSKFTGVNYQTNATSVIVLKDSNYTELSDLENKTIGINQETDEANLTNALSDIRQKVNAEYKSYVDFEHLAQNLYEKKVDAIIVNEAYRGMIEEKYEDFTNKTRVVYQVKIKEKIDNIANAGAVKDGVFNICVTGIDTYGPVSTRSRSDVNMVMTVNMNTHKILMTGIPRDYYVTLASKNAKDKLTHSGIYGVNETVNTLSNLLDVDLDYYFRINFSSLVNLVDTLGGIDVYSDATFVPHTDSSLTIKEGTQHMNGKMALAFSRERYAYASGDRHRIQNQQDVMMALIKKMLTPEILSKYKEVLQKVEGTFETNMSSNDIMTVVNYELNDTKAYEMENMYLDGTGKLTYGLYSMPNSKLYTMIPNESTVKAATQKIKEVESGK